MDRRPGIVQVARRAGVSTAAVSRLLAGDRKLRITPATRERILTAVHELGYVSDVRAQHLGRGAAPVLGVLVPDLQGTYPLALLQMLSSGLVAMQKEILFGLHLGDLQTARYYVDRFRSHRTFATVMLARVGDANRDVLDALDKGARQAGPFIVVSFSERFPDRLSFGIDVRWVAETAIAQFHAAGCASVVCCTRSNAPGALFGQVFSDVLSTLPDVKGEVVPVPGSPQLPFTADAVQRVCEHARRGRVGVLTSVDSDAIRLALMLRRQGLAAPDDVAILGYGNHPFSEFSTPQVSTFDVLGVIPTMAERLLEILRQIDAGQTPEPREQVFRPALIVRETFVPAA